MPSITEIAPNVHRISIGFSHFEVDECGSLNDWLEIAPRAQAVSGVVGSLVNLTDFADRPPRALEADETFSTGRFRFRYRPTPHLPHGWDAGVASLVERGLVREIGTSPQGPEAALLPDGHRMTTRTSRGFDKE